MRKALFLSGIIFVLFLISCGGYYYDDEDYYKSDWEETEGYVISTEDYNERTGKTTTIDEFIEGSHPKDKKIAVQYKHKYDKSRTSRLYCEFLVKTVQDDIDKGIVQEFVTDEKKSADFTITKKMDNSHTGFIFYCDDEYVYVINNLYSLNYVEHDDDDPKNKAECRFEISITGIKQPIKIDMDYYTSKENKPY